MTTGGKKHGKSRDRASEAAEFNLGYFFKTIEDEIVAFTEQEGCPFSFRVAALRLGDALRSKAEKVREELGDPKFLHEMQPERAGSGLRGRASASAEIHVRTRARRTLSAKAIRAISRAQKKRWAKFHAGDKSKGNAMTRKKSDKRKQGITAYWAKMSKAERAAEMQRRQKVAELKKKAA